MTRSYCLMWRKALNFRDRTRRDDFWQAVLCNVFVVVLLVMLSACYGKAALLLQTIYQAISLVPLIAMGIRRLHDIGKSGWFIFLNLLPFFGNVVFFYLMMCGSTAGANKFGDSPYPRLIQY